MESSREKTSCSELVVEARGLSAVGRNGLLFSAISGVIRRGDVAVISGPVAAARTALLLALSGRFSIASGTLCSAGVSGTPAWHRAQLRRQIVVARALPLITVAPTIRVGDALAERRLTRGRSPFSEAAVWQSCEILGIDVPSVRADFRYLHPVEQTLFTVALGCGYTECSGMAVDCVDSQLADSDRVIVRRGMAALADAGWGVLATSDQSEWGDIKFPLEWTPTQGVVQSTEPVESGDSSSREDINRSLCVNARKDPEGGESPDRAPRCHDGLNSPNAPSKTANPQDGNGSGECS